MVRRLVTNIPENIILTRIKATGISLRYANAHMRLAFSLICELCSDNITIALVLVTQHIVVCTHNPGKVCDFFSKYELHRDWSSDRGRALVSSRSCGLRILDI